MKLKVDEILERVSQIEDERSEYVRAAEAWEDMWMLKAFNRTAREAITVDGVEQVTTPTPYNVVQLGLRLVASTPRIEVPSSNAEQDDEEAAKKKQRFLSAFWERTNRQQRVDVIGNAAWLSLVRGRHALEGKWVKDELPKRLRDRRLPILVRTLDPLNVGSKMGPYYTEYAFHKWETTRLVAKQYFPDIRWKSKGRKRKLSISEEDETVELVDFWWHGDDGAVWNAIVIDGDQFGKQPTETDYPEVPIVEGYGDTSPLSDELYKSLSILHPIKELWPYECRLMSQMGTGMLYYFNPIGTYQSEMNDDIDPRPGEWIKMAPDDKLGFVQPGVNMQLAEAIWAKMDGMTQTSTFPNVMYGQQPGQVQAGYAINTLAKSAETRTGRMRSNLEASIELINEIVLGLIEKVGKEEVSVWGTDKASDTIYHETLGPSDIGGYYENTVTLVPDSGQDEQARMMMGMQLAEKRGISWETFRDKFMRLEMPADEKLRIETENAMAGPLGPKTQLRALQKRFPDTWRELIRGTEYEQLAMQEEQPAQPPQPQMPPGMAPGGAPPPPMGMPPQAGGGPPPGPMSGPSGPGLPPMPGPAGPMPGPGLPSNVMPPGMTGEYPPELAAIMEDETIPPEIKAMIAQNPMGAMDQLRAMGVLSPGGMM